jgi:lysozyme
MPAPDTRKRMAPWLVAIALSVTSVASWEGLRTKVYPDAGGVATACYGETNGITKQEYTKVECEQMLRARLDVVASELSKCVTADMPDTRKNALISFAYNVGTGAACRSTAIRELNAGNVKAGCDALLKWTKVDGVELKGLVRRRKWEWEQCLLGW